MIIRVILRNMFLDLIESGGELLLALSSLLAVVDEERDKKVFSF
jgi:hypothetical protein